MLVEGIGTAMVINGQLQLVQAATLPGRVSIVVFSGFNVVMGKKAGELSEA